MSSGPDGEGKEKEVKDDLQPSATITATLAPISATQVVNQGYSFDDFLADVNGGTSFTEDQAAMGTTKPEFYLMLPASVLAKIPFQMTVPTKMAMSSEEARNFCEMNYRSLIAGGIREGPAAFLVTMRLQIVRNGFVCRDTNSRAIYMDEYRRVDQDITTGFTFAPPKGVAQFVTSYWQNIVGVVAHVFQVRGHHYKPEFEKLYTRTWNATTIEVPPGITMPSWEDISRAGLHCFGVRALHEIREWAMSHGVLAKGLVLRRDAAYAGSAPVRTCSAALREMEKARWYSIFYAVHQRSITAVHNEAARIKGSGFRAHINANLYEWGADKLTIEDGAVNTLAPYVVGWLDTLDTAEPIKGQHCLVKRCHGGIAIRQAFASVLLSEARNEKNLTTVREFLNGTIAQRSVI